MLCNAHDRFSLILPTKDRPAFLARTFEFLEVLPDRSSASMRLRRQISPPIGK